MAILLLLKDLSAVLPSRHLLAGNPEPEPEDIHHRLRLRGLVLHLPRALLEVAGVLVAVLQV